MRVYNALYQCFIRATALDKQRAVYYENKSIEPRLFVVHITNHSLILVSPTTDEWPRVTAGSNHLVWRTRYCLRKYQTSLQQVDSSVVCICVLHQCESIVHLLGF